MKKGLGKKAQFFLLAAVIISAIFISIGLTAKNNRSFAADPVRLSDYTFNVKREAGSVIDYEIYSGFDDGANISNFVELLTKDMRDRDPDLNFLFIYGNLDRLIMKNYGTEPVIVDQGPLPGGGYQITSFIKAGSMGLPATEAYDEYSDGWNREYTGIKKDATISVTISENEFNFTPSKYNQVIFIIKKEDQNETYIEIK